MNRALTSLASPLTWLRARLVNVAERRVHGLSLVASWLANAVWLLETTWRSLVTQAYGRNAVVYSCLRLLSQSIPEARLKAYTEDKDGERKELPRDHELSLLLRHPNELMTEFEFLELTTIHLAVVGRSVWWKERDRAGHILNIWPLRPDRVGPIYAPPDSTRDGERVLWGYSYLEPGTATYLRLQRRDCIAFNFPNPDGETGGIVEGFGPLAAISREVAADNKATEHVGALLANYAQPGIALEITEPVDEDQARLIKQKFRQEFGGAQLGTPAVVDAGAKITPFGFNLRELEFPELRENVEARICAATGVPAALVGVKAGLNPTYSNAREAREFFTETTCSMYWRRYGDQLTSDLASEFGDDIIIDFDTSKVRALAGQQVEKLAPIKEGFSSGVVTVDEYRAALNLDPLPDGLGGFVRFPNVLTEVPVTPEAIKLAEKKATEAEAKAAEQAKQQGAVAKNEPEGGQNATVAKDVPPATGGDDASPPGAGGARAGKSRGDDSAPAVRSTDPSLPDPNCHGAATKALDDRTTAWLGLYLPADVADRIALPDGESPEALHMTVAYLGQQPPEVLDALPNIIADWAFQHGPVDGTLSGIGRFNGDDDAKDAVYCSVDAPALPAWRESLVRHLAYHGLVPDKAHGFTPHVTLDYVDKDDETPVDRIDPVAFQFDKLTLSLGDVRRDYVLAGEPIKSVADSADVVVSTFAETTPATETALKAVDPRDADEARLRDALIALFRELLPGVAERIAQGQMPSEDELAEALRKVIEPRLVETAVGEHRRIAAEVGFEADLVQANRAASEWAKQYSYDLVKGLTDVRLETLRKTMGEFHATPGMTRAQLEAKLLPLFGPTAASAISVTEVTRASNQAWVEMQREMDTAGIRARRIWDSLGDDAVCPQCGPLNGQPQDQWPAEAKDGPPLHVACRCSSHIENVAGKSGEDATKYNPYHDNRGRFSSGGGATSVSSHWWTPSQGRTPLTREQKERIASAGGGERPIETDLRRQVEPLWSQEGLDQAAKARRLVREYIAREGSQQVDGKILAHGMTDMEPMHSVPWNGMTIRFQKGVSDTVVVDAMAQLASSKPFPPELSKHTKEIIFTQQTNSSDGYWGRTYNIPNFSSYATGGDGRVVIYNNKYLNLPSLAHEMGHNLGGARYMNTDVAYRKDGRTASDWIKVVVNSKEPPLSNYAKNGPGEDFAETVKQYYQSPAAVQKHAPQRYGVVSRLIVDPGYEG